MATTRTADKTPVVNDYVHYEGSLVKRWDIYLVTAINADGTYELQLEEGHETVRLHTVRRASIFCTGGRKQGYQTR